MTNAALGLLTEMPP